MYVLVIKNQTHQKHYFFFQKKTKVYQTDLIK